MLMRTAMRITSRKKRLFLIWPRTSDAQSPCDHEQWHVNVCYVATLSISHWWRNYESLVTCLILYTTRVTRLPLHFLYGELTGEHMWPWANSRRTVAVALLSANGSGTRLSYRKDDRAMRPIYGCPDKFRESLSTPTAIFFAQIFNGLLFWSIVWIRVQNFKFAALPVPKIIGGTLKIWTVPGYPRSLFSKILMRFSFNVPAKFEVCSFTRSWAIIAIEVLGERCEPQSWGRGGRRGSGMVPFERALVSSYRPSIVTFPLSLRVSETLSLLCSSTPLFPIQPLLSSKFPQVLLGVCGCPLGYKERRCWANCPCN